MKSQPGEHFGQNRPLCAMAVVGAVVAVLDWLFLLLPLFYFRLESVPLKKKKKYLVAAVLFSSHISNHENIVNKLQVC